MHILQHSRIMLFNTYIARHITRRGTNHNMVVVHDVRLFRNRLGALILSRLAELRQEVVHHKDALDGTILLN